MARLTLSLFGTLAIVLNGRPVAGLAYRKLRALLAYLAVESSRSHSRDSLAGLLWPDKPDARARHSLSQALVHLRQALNDRAAEAPFLIATRETIQFNPASDYQLDIKDFSSLIAACERHAHAALEDCHVCAAWLAQAVALYRGDFLDHIAASVSAAFEQWALFQRERLHWQVLQALSQLTGHHLRQGAYGEARRCALRQLELEPWREEAHLQLMLALALSGQRTAALVQFERCRAILAEQLGVEPAAGTTDLYARIRGHDLNGPDRSTHKGGWIA